MTNDPIYVLKPVFDFLDNLIRAQGDRLFMAFAYLCLFAIGWILSGGLGRRLPRGRTQCTATTVIAIRPTGLQFPPLLPIIGDNARREDFPAGDDSSDGFVV